jgi:hypothetical protein
MAIPDGKALWGAERERVNSGGTVAYIYGRLGLGDFPRAVCRNRFRLLFFRLNHGIDPLEESVQNPLQSGAGTLLLGGLEETFPEFLQLFVSHCTSTNCNKDTAARYFLSGEKTLTDFQTAHG